MAHNSLIDLLDECFWDSVFQVSERTLIENPSHPYKR